MKRTIATLALLTATIAVPAHAEQHTLAVYRTYGACVSAWAAIDKEFWNGGKADGTLANRGNTYPSPVGCTKVGDLWHLVTVEY